jgi:hypothetical protein
VQRSLPNISMHLRWLRAAAYAACYVCLRAATIGKESHASYVVVFTEIHGANHRLMLDLVSSLSSERRCLYLTNLAQALLRLQLSRIKALADWALLVRQPVVSRNLDRFGVGFSVTDDSVRFSRSTARDRAGLITREEHAQLLC